MAKPHLWCPRCFGWVGHLLGILTVVFTLFYTPCVVAQTPTITLAVPANSQFEEGKGNTTVVVTATLSAPQTSDTVIDLSLAGTSKSTDYAPVTLPDITIPANSQVGTADLILNPVDDNFFEGQETVIINGSATGAKINGVAVPLIDNDAKPTLNFYLLNCVNNNCQYEEGYTFSTYIVATLTGGIVFEEDQAVTVSLDLEKPIAVGNRPSLSDFNFGEDDPPWDFTIPAGTTSGRRAVSFTIVDDTERENAEHVFFKTTLMAGGEDFTKSLEMFFIQLSDQPLNIYPTCSQSSVHSTYLGTTFTTSCKLITNQNQMPSKDYTVTYTAEDSDVIDPETFTLTLEKGATESPEVDKTFTTTEDTPAIVGFNASVNPNDQEVTAHGIHFHFFPKLIPAYKISDYQLTIWQGYHKLDGLLLQMSFYTRRPIEVIGTPEVEVILDSGTITLTCPTRTNSVSLECTPYSVQEGDFDFDGFIEIPQGGIKMTGWRDLQEGVEATGTFASPMPATRTKHAYIGSVYGGSHPIDLAVSPQTVQEGTGEQMLTIIAQIPDGVVSNSDLVIPLNFTNISTSPEDYSVKGPLSVTIKAGATEGRTTAVLFTPNDDLIKENIREVVSIEGSKGAGMTPFVKGAELTILDAAGLKLSVSPTEIDEDGGSQKITVTAEFADAGDSLIPRDIVIPLTWSGTATSADYSRTGGGTVTIPANQRSGTAMVTITPTNDKLLEGDETIAINGVVPGRTVQGTELTLKDDEMTPQVKLSVDPTSLLESASATSFTVSAELDPTVKDPINDTTVTLNLGGTATEGTDYTKSWSPTSPIITIPKNTTSGSNTVTLMLTPTNDNLAEGDETIVVEGKAPRVPTPLEVRIASITLEDDDAKGINLTPEELTVVEGDTATYEVWLGTEPTGDVTVSLSSSNATTASTDLSELTFTTVNWETKQTVTVTGIDDNYNNVDDMRTADISHTAGGGGYDDVALATLGVEVTDDDEAASFSIADASATEGSAITFTVTRSGATGGTASVKWNTAADTTDGAVQAATTDYSAQTTAQTLTFAASEGTKTFTVATTADALREGDETFLVVLSEPSAGTSIKTGEGTATGTITDDDAAPTTLTLTLDTDTGTTKADNTIAEDGGAKTVRVTATLGGTNQFDVEKTVTVKVGKSGDSANERGDTDATGDDYEEVDDFEITIPARAQSATGDFTITPNDDDIHEADETISVEGTLAGVAVTGTTITLTSEDPAPSFSIEDASATEGSAIIFTVSRVGGTGDTASVKWATAEDTTKNANAASTADYTAQTTAQTLTFAAGEGTKTFTVATTNDVYDEPNETFQVVLSEPSAGTPIDDGTAIGTITDNDDPPAITLSVDTDSVTNGNQNTIAEDGEAATFTVTATLGDTQFPTDQVIPITIGDTDDTAKSGVDYTAVTAKNITIPANTSSGTVDFTLTPTNDTRHEDDETISIDGTLTDVTVTGTALTLTSEDAAPTTLTLAVDSDTNTSGEQKIIAETAATTTFTVTATLGGSTQFDEDKTVTVKVGKSADSAKEGTDPPTAGTDYALVADLEIEILAGEQSAMATFDLSPTDDTLFEPDETISVEGTLASVTVTHTAITLTSEDVAPSFSIADAEATEGTAIEFTVTRAGALGNEVTVDWVTAPDATEDADAASDSDYAASTTAQTLTFAAGVASQTIEIATTGDLFDEPNETFQVVLSSPSTGTSIKAGEGTATGTITDNDFAPEIILTVDADDDTDGDQYNIAEDGDAKTVRVTATLRSSRFETAKVVTIIIGDAKGEATEGTDYETVDNQTITIPANSASSSVTFDITPIDDTLYELGETISIKATLAGVTSINNTFITLTSEDVLPSTLTLAVVDTDTGTDGVQTTIAENGGVKTVRVTATLGGTTQLDFDETVTVTIGKAGDSATEGGNTLATGDDYAKVDDLEIEIPAGEQSATGDFMLTPIDDTLFEADEIISVDGTSADFTVTGTTITLTSEDAVPSFSIADAEATEGTAIEFTVTRAGATGNAATVDWVTAPDATEDADAASDSDYTTSTTAKTLTFAANDETKTISVATTNDVYDEPNETFQVVLSGATGGATITDETATGTINDNDDPPAIALSLTDADTATTGTAETSIAEDGSAKTVRITATLGATQFDEDKTVTLTIGKTTDSAKSGVDYTAVTEKTITIPADTASAHVDFPITPTDDTLHEDDETISIEGTLDGATVTGTDITLTSEDAAPTTLKLTLDADTGTNNVQDSIAENGGPKTVRVTATLGGTTQFDVAKTVTVTVGKSTDSATEGGNTLATGDDYEKVEDFEIEIPAGAQSASGNFTLTPIDDAFQEKEEIISVEGTLAGITSVTNTSIKLTSDDGAPTLTLAVDADTGTNNVQDSIAEGGGAKTVRVTATLGDTRFPTAKAVTVKVGKTTDSAKEGTDYTAVADQTITIPANTASVDVTFTLTPTNDVFHEADETISIEGTLAGVTSVTNTSITLTSEDAAPAITLSVDADTGTDGVQTSITEDGGAKTVRVTATLTGTTRFEAAEDVTIMIGDPDGPANEATEGGDTPATGDDYAEVDDLEIEIPANTTSASITFTLTPTTDTLYEADEIISVDGTLTGVTFTPTAITLTSEDAVPSFSIAAASATEGSAIKFTVTRAGALGNVVSVKWVTAEDTTKDAVVASTADYTASTTAQTLTFAAGVASQTISVATTADLYDEPDETFQVVLSEPSRATITDATAIGTITDNDAAPAITLTVDADTATTGTAETSIAEGGGGKTVRVTATLGDSRFPTAQDVTITIGKSTDSAKSGVDYTAVTEKTITIPANTASDSVTFTLTPTNDTLHEASETISIEGELTGTTVNGTSITLTSEDAAPTTLTLKVDSDTSTTKVDDTIAEDGGATSFTVTATLGGATQFDVDKTVAVTIGKSDDTATEGGNTLATGDDYAKVDDLEIEIPAGEQSATGTFTITPVDDDFHEGNEAISVDGTLTGVTVTGTSITLTSEDAAPTFSIAAASATEGSAIEFTVTRAGATGKAATVKWVTANDGDGTNPASTSDYAAKTTAQTINFAAGSSSETITVATTNDVYDEPDETFLVVLSSPSEGTITDATATGTIEDNDAAPAITLTVDADTATPNVQTSMAENGSAKTVRVTASLTGTTRLPSQQALTITVGKSTDSATEGTDYTVVADQTITIAADGASASVTFTLTPTNDTLHEEDETISIESELTGGTVTPTTITLTSEDAAPTTLTLKVDADTGTNGVQTSIAENGGAKIVQVTATLGGTTQFDEDKTVTVTIGKSDDTATEGGNTLATGDDYAKVDDLEIEIPAGEQSATETFTITPVNDDFHEANETISIEGVLAGITTFNNTSITLTSEDTAPAITLSVDADTATPNDQTSMAEDGGGKTVRVTATLGDTKFPTAQNVTIIIGKSSDTANEGTDYTTVGNKTITIPANTASASVTFTLTPINDKLLEGDETIMIEGTVPGETVGGTVITLTDDEMVPAVTLSVNKSSLSESGQAEVVTISAILDPEVAMANDVTTVTLNLGGTATEAADYAKTWSPDPPVISIPQGDTAGSNTVTLTLTPTDDKIVEGDETIIVQGTATTDMASRTLVVKVAQITLEDDDAKGINLSPKKLTVAEADNPGTTSTTENVGTYEVWLGTEPSGDVMVSLSSTDATVATTTPAELTFTTSNWDTRQTVTLTGKNDDHNNAGNKRNASIRHTAAGGGYNDAGVVEMSVTVTDDDEAPTFSIADASATEGQAITFTVNRAGAKGDVASVKWNTATDTTGDHPASANDYTPQTTAQPLSFAAGDTSKTFTVQTTADVHDEENETFLVMLSDASAGTSIADATATGTITDNDAAPAITLTVDADTTTTGTAETSIAEGGGAKTVQVTATLTGTTRLPTQQVVTITIGDSDDTATEGTDYTAVTDQTITIPANTASANVTFTLTPTNDTFHEGDETISIEGELTGVTVTGTSITLTSEDVAPSFSIADASATEGTAIEFTVTRAGATGNAATVKWVTANDGDGTNPASTADYTTSTTAQTIDFAAGSSSETITVATTADLYDEEDETFLVVLSSPSEGTLTNATATGTIEDNDAAPAITLAVDADTGTDGDQTSIAENGSAKTVKVTATLGATRFETAQNVTIIIGDTDDDATEGTAYETVSNQTITIAADGASGTTTFTLTPTDDTLHEGSETITIESTLAGVTITPTSITITDNDTAPEFSIADASATEGSAITFTVTRSGATGATASVKWNTANDADGTHPASTSDYTEQTTAQTLSFAAGDTVKTFTVATTADTLNEDDETFLVVLSDPSAGTSIKDGEGTATGTITDNDTAPTTLTLTLDADTGTGGVQDSIAEDGGAKTVRVTATLGGTTTTQFDVAKTVTVAIGKAADTATEGTDYTAVNDFEIEIPAGDQSASANFTLTPTNDVYEEEDETISAEGTLAGTTATNTTITLTSEDAAPTITLTVDADTGTDGIQTSIAENGSTKTVRVTATLTGTTRFEESKDVTIIIGDTDDDATEGTDYETVTNKTITIAKDAASNTVTFDITPTDDTLHEGSETIAIAGTLAGATITPTSITMTDNDTAPEFSIADASATEGSAITFTVTRSGASGDAVSVKWVTANDGDGTNPASTADYTEQTTAQTLSFAAGDTSKTITIATTNDVYDEPDETFQVVLSEPSTGTTIDDGTAIGTITDNDDAPAITLSVDADTGTDGDQPSIAEGGGVKTVRVTATLGDTQFPTGQTVTITVGKTTDTATSDVDYTAVTNKTITIPADTASADVTFDITPTDDTLHEGNETITIEGTLAGVTVSGTTITMTDNDTAPEFSIADASATEGSAITFTVTRSGATGATASVKWNTTADTTDDAHPATATDDYTPQTTAQTLSFATGDTVKTFTVATTADTLNEDDETFLVVLSDPSDGTTIDDGTATGTITDNDAAPTTLTLTLDADTATDGVQTSIAENGGAKTVRVTATLGGTTTTQFDEDKTVTVAIGKGTDSATEGTDYTAVTNKEIEIPAGEQSASVEFTLTPTNDVYEEEDETISVEGTLAGTTATNTAITLTSEDAAPAITLTVDADTATNSVQTSIAEDGGAKTVRVTATLTGTTRLPTQQAVTVTIGKADDTATEGTDYTTVANQTITIPADTASTDVTFTLTPTNDTLVENDETISIDGSLAGATVTGTTITLTSEDVAPAIEFSIANASATEGSAITFTVTRSGATGGTASVKWTTTADTTVGADAATTTDYTATTTAQTLSFAVGVASQTITVATTNDVYDEPDETFQVVLSEPSDGTTIDDGTAIGTITDNDDAPAITLSVDADTGTNGIQNSIAENGGAKTARVTATLTGTTRLPSSQDVTIEIGKTADSATEGTDYTEITNKTITIPADTASGSTTFTLTPTNDTLVENDETISIDGSFAGATVTGTTITLTSEDVAPAIEFSIANASATEGTAIQFTVSRTGATGDAVSVKWATAEDTTVGADAASTSDYTATTTAQTLSFAAGVASQTISVATTNDVYDEPNETFQVVLSDPSTGTTIDDGTAIGTITDNDDAPAITLTVDADTGTDGIQTSIAEDGGAKTVRVTATLTGTTRLPTSQDVTIEIGKTADSATEGTDYTTIANQTITIPADTASADVTFTLTPTNDALVENDETISIDGTLAGVTITGTTITMTSEDTAQVIEFSIDDASATEGSAITFTVTRSGATGGTASVKWNTANDADGANPASASDYTEQTTAQTLSFAANESAKTFTVQTTNDVYDEPNETFQVVLSDPSTGTTIDDGTAIGTITDNDDAPAITLSVDADTGTNGVQTSIAEDGGGKTVRVTATLGDTRFPSSQDVTIEIGKTTDSATEGTDYTAVTAKTITIPANTVSADVTFTLTPTNDAFEEDNETISIDGSLAGVTITPTAITLTSEDTAPIMTINSPSVMEGTSEMYPLNFVVSLDSASTKRVTVDYADAGTGTATAGADYEAITAGTLVFEPGETSKILKVMVRNDLINEESETVVVRLSSPSGAKFPGDVTTLDGTGTINNVDLLPQGWLSRFGRTVTEQVLDAISGRVSQEHYPGIEGTFAGLGLDFGPTYPDQSYPRRPRTSVSLESGLTPGSFTASGNTTGEFNSGSSFENQAFNNDSREFPEMTAQEALLGSSFAVTREREGGSYSFWGRVSEGRFESKSPSENVDISLEGKVTTGMIGADQSRGKWLVGIAVAKSSGEGRYSSIGPTEQELTASESGRIETSLTALVPYASLKYSERTSIWTALGFGSGTMTLIPRPNESNSANIDWNMAALGLRSDLLTSPRDDGSFRLAITSDAMWTKISSEETASLPASDSDVSRFRVGLEGSWYKFLDDGSSITPNLEVGIRYDGGDAETGLGIEVGGGILWDNPMLGISFGVSGRTLVVHEDNDFADRGLSAWLIYDPNPASHRGPSASIRQDFDGNAQGGVDTLFNPTPLENRRNSEDTSRTSIEVAYGFPAFGENYTGSPHAGADLATNSRDYRIGWRLTPEAPSTPDFSFDIVASRAEYSLGAPDHAAGFEIATRW